MHCSICIQPIRIEATWSTLLNFTDKTLCHTCEQQFKRIEPPYCKRCMKPIDSTLCDDCQFWENKFGTDPLDQNISIYQYNDFMKETMAAFKYRGDYEIAQAWKKSFHDTYQKQFNQLQAILPIPLAKDRWNERGFNQAEALAKLTGKPLFGGIIRTDTQKQSKKSRWERIFSENPFELTESPPETLLIIDDIFTTGTTIRQGASLLKNQGVNQVFSLTLVRS